MSWGTRRRNTVLFTLFLLIGIPVGFIAFLLFYKAPNCFDGLQNSDESGVDCGGSCQLVCTQEATRPAVLWERYFKVSEGVYNVMAYVENPNPGTQVVRAPYSFKLYNTDNVLIGEQTGEVTLEPKSVLPIIRNNIQTFKQIPARVSFEFAPDLVFEKKNPGDPVILIKDELVENEGTAPRIRAKMQNISLRSVSDIEAIVITYNSFDTVLGVSSTYIPMLASEETRDIVFTWPEPFTEAIARIEVIPIYAAQ